MTIVNFYETADDGLLKFAVIIAKSEGKFIFCKHKARDTWEIPGGYREPGEIILDTAKRELYEETDAILVLVAKYAFPTELLPSLCCKFAYKTGGECKTNTV